MPDSSVKRFEHDGATLLAESFGVGDRVFVLIHGIGMGRGIFADLIDRLTPHGRVVVFDLPGYGEAPEPPRIPTIERLADLVAAYVYAERMPRPVLIGHSMGTQIAVETVARHPGLIDQVVLVGPTVHDRERTALRQLLRLGQDLLGESLKVLIVGGREYLRAGPNLRRKMKAMLVHEPEHTYPRVDVPALVLRGETDTVCPRDWCMRVTAALPDARLEEVPGHGHETLIRDAAPAAERILAFVATPR